MNISSTASTSSNGTDTFDHKVSDFKGSLKLRKTPKTLVRLNWIMIGVLLCILGIASVDFNLLNTNTADSVSEDSHNMHTVRRTNMIVQHASNFRTFNILSNNIVDPNFSFANLNLLMTRQNFIFNLLKTQTL